MRKLILAATLALGLGGMAGTASAAPGFAPQPDIAAMSEIVQVRDHHYGRHHWRGSRNGHGRQWGGPPPHARAYGYRRHHYGYYGRDRQWDRTW